MKVSEINFLDIEENENYSKTINQVLIECFKTENLQEKKLYVNIVLTNLENIHKINKQYRNIDKPTDVLSFPMFEKDEISKLENNNEDILGDIVISIEQVEKQAVEYEHSFTRELAYMVVHGFYHLMGYDHIKEEDKAVMRPKEEFILNKLNILN